MEQSYLKKLVVAHLVKKFAVFLELDG